VRRQFGAGLPFPAKVVPRASDMVPPLCTVTRRGCRDGRATMVRILWQQQLTGGGEREAGGGLPRCGLSPIIPIYRLNCMAALGRAMSSFRVKIFLNMPVLHIPKAKRRAALQVNSGPAAHPSPRWGRNRSEPT